MSRIITAELYPHYDTSNYPYVGMSLTGSQVVLFGDKGVGVVLSGDREGQYSECFIENMFQPIGTRLDFYSNNAYEEKFPCVTQGDDGMSMYFMPYRLYFSKDKFMAFQIHDDGSVTFGSSLESDFSGFMSFPAINVEIDFP